MVNLAAFALGEGEEEWIPEEPAEIADVAIFLDFQNAHAYLAGQSVSGGSLVVPGGEDFYFIPGADGGFQLQQVFATNIVTGLGVPIEQDGDLLIIRGGFIVDGLILTIQTFEIAPQIPSTPEPYNPDPNMFGPGFWNDPFNPLNGPIGFLPANGELGEGEEPKLQVGLIPGALPTSGNIIEILSGTSVGTVFAIGGTDMDGAIVLLPKSSALYADSSITSVGASNAIIGELNGISFTLDGSTISGDFWVIVFPHDEEGAFTSTFAMSHSFQNGISPEGAQQILTVYAFEAENVGAGNGITLTTPSGPVETAFDFKEDGVLALPANSYLIQAKTNETITVNKTRVSVSEGEPVNSALVSRPYGEAQLGTNDSYSITYQIGVSTSGNGLITGRIFQEYITIEDTLSGFLTTGLPTSITVNGVSVPSSNWTVSGDSLTFSFNHPVLANQAITNGTHTVVVTFSKADYTNMYGQPEIITGPVTVNNQARVVHKPVVSMMPVTTSWTAMTNNSFGWKQAEPGKVPLNIQKKISVSGQEYNYTTNWQNIYGTTTPVTFTLTPQAGSPPQATVLTATVDGNGIINFPDLTPGTTYILTETVGVNDAKFDKVANATVVVSNLSTQGTATVTIDGTGYTGTTYNVTNPARAIGSISVNVERQLLHQSPAVYQSFANKVVELWEGSTKIAEATTDASGLAAFYDLDATKTYTLKGTPEAGYDTPELTGLAVS
ncbi:MAG: hypothetical protein FWE65_00760, partial [Eggerthellaceae bacterium]|nr:hypothetical protein [Eggerthellaceae bacterium]